MKESQRGFSKQRLGVTTGGVCVCVFYHHHNHATGLNSWKTKAAQGSIEYKVSVYISGSDVGVTN